MVDKIRAVRVEGYRNEHTPDAEWYKSPFSNPQHVDDCVAFSPLPNGGIAIASTREPDRKPLTYDAGEVRAFIQGVAAGAFDGLTA
ncbi:DUF397 domain-containing protein [Yinghuangia sp. YIM S09857]|uniref:DUF397 domain-containing protein n=1 Tax=Yinghuangia sp. YIM S09857 TaxID=3436929 RepID=UPI003F52AAA5